MKIDPTTAALLREQFQQLASKEDLLRLLNVAKKELYGPDFIPISLQQLTYYANPTLSKKRYKSFKIAKKSGGDRTIHAPVPSLKGILRSLNLILQCIFEAPHVATGFVPGKSIVDNAAKHVGRHYVLNVDLKDFFHSFTRNDVKLAFMYEPFDLREDREPLAFLLASLCTHPLEVDGKLVPVLPQGSPVSPVLTNILCRKLDRRLTGLAKRYGLIYTRYADDLTFSSQKAVLHSDEFWSEFNRIVHDLGLQLNDKKTRLQGAGYTQEVTGLLVNEKVNVSRKFIKELRKLLYYWEEYGYERASELFLNDQRRSNAANDLNSKQEKKLQNVLEGKLNYLKMVKGAHHPTFQKLDLRFQKCQTSAGSVTTKRAKNLEEILDIFVQSGLEEAMQVYRKMN